MKISKRCLEALEIIRDKEWLARGFGLVFWKDHPAHKHHTKGRDCVQVGKKGWLMAGSYLGKLRRKRLVDFGYGNVFTYRLSKLGKEILFKNKL